MSVLQRVHFDEDDPNQKFTGRWHCERCNQTFFSREKGNDLADCPKCNYQALPTIPSCVAFYEPFLAATAAQLVFEYKSKEKERIAEATRKQIEALHHALEDGKKIGRYQILPELYFLIKEVASKGETCLLYRYDPLSLALNDDKIILNQKLKGIQECLSAEFLNSGYTVGMKVSNKTRDPSKENIELYFKVEYPCLEIIISW